MNRPEQTTDMLTDVARPHPEAGPLAAVAKGAMVAFIGELAVVTTEMAHPMVNINSLRPGPIAIPKQNDVFAGMLNG